MMWWFDSNKTKPNKTKNQAPSFFANLGLNIEGLCSFHCGIVRRNVRVFFFFFCFSFFLKKIPKNEGNNKSISGKVKYSHTMGIIMVSFDEQFNSTFTEHS